MSIKVIDTSNLTAIADAIRAKTGGTSQMSLADMPTQIGSIGDMPGKPEHSFVGIRFNVTSFSPSAEDIAFMDTYVTNYQNMFNGCKNLVSADLTGLNPSKVYYTDHMFYGCAKLTSVNMGSIDTSRCLDMSSMFTGCYVLQSLDLSGLDTSSVTNMNQMFNMCYALTDLDISGFDVSKVWNLTGMFIDTKALTNIKWPDVWDMSSYKNDTLYVNYGPLSHDSVLQLFNALKPGLSKKIKLSSTSYGYMSEDEIAIATDKGYTITY